MGLVSRRVVFKPLLTLLQRRERLACARKYRNYIVADWQKVIWSDEKLFRVRPGGMVRRWVPKHAGRFNAKYIMPVVAKPQSLMVWAAINGRGQLILRRCPKKVNAQSYQDILDTAKAFIRPRLE